MSKFSFADISYEQGLALVLFRKQALARGDAAPMPAEVRRHTGLLSSLGRDRLEKHAFNIDTLKETVDTFKEKAKDYANSAGQYYKNLDPAGKNVLQLGLAGSGLGALYGLGRASADPQKKPRYLNNMLMGAVGGGALGGGLGLALNSSAAADKLLSVSNALAALGTTNTSNAPGTSSALGASAAPAAAPALPENSLANRAQLAGVADSLNPEVALLTQTGLAGTLPAAGGVLLHNRQSYDPMLLAKQLHTHKNQLVREAERVLSNPAKLADKIKYDNKLEALLTVLGLENQKSGPLPKPFKKPFEFLNKLTPKPLEKPIENPLEILKDLTPEKIVELLNKNPDLRYKAFTGTGMSQAGLNKVVSALGGKPDEVLKSISQRGIRGIPRRAGALGLAAASAAGIGASVLDYLKQRKQRNDAKLLLEQLSSQSS